MSEPAPALTPVAEVSDKPPQSTAADQAGVTYSHPPDYFTAALEDAERLLKYAAEIGVEIDDTTRDSVLKARAAVTTGWNEKTAADLLTALTVLAARLKPVTAESLRSFQSRPTVRVYWIVALCLAVVIVPFSVASFITSGSSGLANLIRNDITNANAMAVTLTTQLTPFTEPAAPDAQQQSTKTSATAAAPSGNPAASTLPPGVSPTEVVTELQTFASLIRSIHARSRQMNKYIFPKERDPFAEVLQQKDGYKSTFQLPVPLPDDVPRLQKVLSGRVMVFQDTRQFGQDVTDDASVAYGAIGTCILPVLYALLGTCAYLLRSYSQSMSTRTFVRSHSDSAHFLIAGIAGCVVGLFNNFSLAGEHRSRLWRLLSLWDIP